MFRERRLGTIIPWRCSTCSAAQRNERHQRDGEQGRRPVAVLAAAGAKTAGTSAFSGQQAHPAIRRKDGRLPAHARVLGHNRAAIQLDPPAAVIEGVPEGIGDGQGPVA
jgi:hypothetical protein